MYSLIIYMQYIWLKNINILICVCIESSWESKEIKSNITPTQAGIASDFKYLIRIPKQSLEQNTNNSDISHKDGNSRWNEKYHDFDEYDDSDMESDDDEEEIVILRCQTSICQDGDKCVPFKFDFVVHVRYGDEISTPQAADTNFSYTIPHIIRDNNQTKAISNNDSSNSNISTNVDTSSELMNDISTSTDNLTTKIN